MSRKIEATVFGLVQPTVEQLGYKLIEVEFTSKKAAVDELVLYIDHENGIGLEDCEAVSAAVDPLLDEADPIEDAYILCVSSPGIDRPIVTDADYEAHIGQKVDVKLYQKIEGSKEFAATLVSFTADLVTLTTEKKEIQIQRDKIALLRPHIDF